MQPRLGVKVLPGEAQVEDEVGAVAIGVLIGCQLAERIVEDRPVPDDGAGIDHLARTAEMIGLHRMHRATGHHAYRQIIEPDLFIIAVQRTKSLGAAVASCQTKPRRQVSSLLVDATPANGTSSR